MNVADLLQSVFSIFRVFEWTWRVAVCKESDVDFGVSSKKKKKI